MSHIPTHRQSENAPQEGHGVGEGLLHLNEQVEEGAVELAEGLLTSTFRPQPDEQQGPIRLEDDDEEEEIARKRLPWWKKPSPWWILCVIPISAIAQSGTMAPRIEIYTILACRASYPEAFENIPHVFSPISTGPEFAAQQELPVSFTGSAERTPSEYHQNLPQNETSVIQHVTFKVPPACQTDPAVQAAVAKLSAVVTATMGVLSLLTTGWWGSFSDRFGRTKIMVLSLIGLVITDLNFIFVYYFSEYLPGGYWFFVVGPVFEGLLGGFSSAVAAIHAYLADTTSDKSRARIFSLNLGLLFAGMAVGPTVAALLMRLTGQAISVFYGAAVIHVLYTMFVWVILPESLTKKKMALNRLKRDQTLRETIELNTWKEKATALGTQLAIPLRPLAVLLPDLVEVKGHPLKKRRRDWNLAFLAIAYGCTISIMGIHPYTFQYASSQFHWSTESIGYWLSSIGATRAAFLTLILPVVIKLFKPKPLVIEIPRRPSGSERQPLLSSDEDPTGTPESEAVPPTIKKELHSPAFELGIARFSLVIDVVAYLLMGLATSSPIFAASGLLGALGIGFSPSVQSCSLALYARKGGIETGKLFGALSVVQALCSQILGPTIYGVVYVRTVATFPQAVFFAGVASLTIGLVLVAFVRLPKDSEFQKEILDAYRRVDRDAEGQPDDQV